MASEVGISAPKRNRAISSQFISSEVSAMLLFLIAGYPSDAAEMARYVREQHAGGSSRRLVEALAGLGDGRLTGILEPHLSDDR
jgi:hypothetical protein